MRQFSAFLIAVLLITACGDDDNGVQTFNGKGSTWEMTFNPDGTCSGTESESTSTVNCTYEDLSTGFRKLTITGGSGSQAPAAGDTAWAMVVPGVAMFIVPVLSGESKPIALLRKGNCPTSDASYTWIKSQVTSSKDMTATNQDYFGKFTTTNNGTTVTVNTGRRLTDFAQKTGDSEQTFTGSCSSGVGTVSGGGDGGTMYYTAGGPIMIAAGPVGSQETLFGVPNETLNLSSLAGNYHGMVYLPAGSSESDKFKPATLSLSGSSTGNTITLKNGPESGATNYGSASLIIDNVNSPHTGVLTGRVDGTTDGNIALAVATNVAGTGRTVIFGVGQQPDNTTKGYVTLFVSNSSSGTTASFTNFFESLFMKMSYLFR